MKNDYLGKIEAAGFGDIQIQDETSFSIDLMANDPTASAVIEKQGLSPEGRNRETGAFARGSEEGSHFGREHKGQCG